MQSTKVVVLVAVVGALLATPASAEGPLSRAWSGFTYLDHNASGSDPDVAAQGRKVHAVWNDGVHCCPLTRAAIGPVLYRRSGDFGSTWKSIKYISHEATGEPSVAVSGSNVHVVWAEPLPDGNSIIRYRRSTNGGRSWEGPVRIDGNATASWDTPDVAVFGTGVFVVWGDNGMVRFRSSDDRGVTWSRVSSISRGDYPSIDATGTALHVVFLFQTSEGASRTGPSYRVDYARSSNEGGKWSKTRNLSKSTMGGLYTPDTEVSAAGRYVHVVWDEGPGYRRSHDRGATWEGVRSLGEGCCVSAVTSGRGEVHVAAYSDNEALGNPPFELIHLGSTDDGATFSAPTAFQGFAAGGFRPVSTVLSRDRLHIVVVLGIGVIAHTVSSG